MFNQKFSSDCFFELFPPFLLLLMRSVSFTDSFKRPDVCCAHVTFFVISFRFSSLLRNLHHSRKKGVTCTHELTTGHVHKLLNGRAAFSSLFLAA
jgi:hypothetical protein